MSGIHPTAVVHPEAKIGHDVSIGPHVVIEENVTIGDGCSFGPGAVIHRNTRMGDRNAIHAHAVLGDAPQDLAFHDQETFLQIGNDNIFREGMTIHRGTKEGSATVVGDHCFLMAYSHLGHNCSLGNHVILVNNVMLAGYVEVGDNAFFGGGCGVHQFVKIGRLAMIGGNASISQDVPPFCTACPALLNQILGLNTVGLRRGGLTGEERLELKRAFKLFFVSGKPKKEVVEELKAEHAQGPVFEFADFLENSKRGICDLHAATV